MGLLRLPPELIDRIAEHNPRASLPALALAHSSLLPIAQRILYRHIDVSDAAGNADVVRVLAANVRLVQHVRSLSLRIDDSSLSDAITTILPHATELTSLGLHLSATPSIVLKHGHCPRLVSFATTFPLDRYVIDFLNSTPCLTSLEVDSSSQLPVPVPVLPPQSCPNLVSFVGSAQAAAVVVPGRPVRSVHLNSGDLGPVEDMSFLSLSTKPVTVLGATTSLSVPAFLHSLSQHIPTLVYLRLGMLNESDYNPDETFYESIAAGLDLFNSLESFDLSGMPWPRTDLSDGHKRVWQSAPYAVSPSDDDLEYDPDFDGFYL